MDISNKNVLIAGGGETALRKADILLSFGANITVVAPYICRNILENEKITKINRPFNTGDIYGAFMVIAATNNSQLNKQISEICFKNKIPVNVVDDIELCSFIFPSIVKDKDIVCAISSGGKSPSATQYVKKILKSSLPPYLGDINSRVGDLRNTVKSFIPCRKKREEIFRNIFELLIKTENKATKRDIELIIEKAVDKNEKN